jgi:hypothetical protein
VIYYNCKTRYFDLLEISIKLSYIFRNQYNSETVPPKLCRTVVEHLTTLHVEPPSDIIRLVLHCKKSEAKLVLLAIQRVYARVYRGWTVP